MARPFLGGEALAAGVLTRHRLRSRFTPIYPGVYLPLDAELTARVRAEAAWLWSRRTGVLTGRSAAAIHGAKWLDPRAPADLLSPNRHPPRGIHTWADDVADDEVELIDGMRVTTRARTALHLARHLPEDAAIAAIDALLHATRTTIADVELLASRHAGRRGIRRARTVLDLVDPGAESPRETSLRLLIVRAGLPRPQTQLQVTDQYG